jgi:hypothetical protein
LAFKVKFKIGFVKKLPRNYLVPLLIYLTRCGMGNFGNKVRRHTATSIQKTECE